MLLPISLLRMFVDVDTSVQETAEIFYSLGFGVESVHGDVIDLEITPNRGDALSILGCAREYSAYTSKPLHNPFDKRTILPINDEPTIHVTITTPLVPFYRGYSIEIQNNQSSPQWIKNILKIYGIHAINTVVDITNITMLLFGQPLHAFDCSSIHSTQMTIRESIDDESVEILNGKTISLKKGSLVGDDGTKLIDLVGIQGGKSSGVTHSSKNILLQAIDCDPVTIRSTSKTLSLATESSYRFERGIDRNGAHSALTYALSLLEELCNAKLHSIISHKTFSTRTIKFNTQNVSRLLGTDISSDDCFNYLRRLGFDHKGSSVYVPSWRLHDIYIEEDLIEEIARLYGYNKLRKEQLPASHGTTMPTQNIWDTQRTTSHALQNLGFDEVLTYSFISSKNIPVSDRLKYRKVINPLSEDHAYLRNSIIPLLVKAAEFNIWMPSLSLFEIGTVFTATSEEIKIALLSTDKIPFIQESLSIVPNQLPYKTRKKYYVWEGSIDECKLLIPHENTSVKLTSFPFKNVSKYQPTVVDIACIVDRKYSIEQIRVTLHLIDKKIILVEPFDIYSNKKFGVDKISYAFHILLDNSDNNFTALSLNKIISNIHTVLVKTYDAHIR